MFEEKLARRDRKLAKVEDRLSEFEQKLGLAVLPPSASLGALPPNTLDPLPFRPTTAGGARPGSSHARRPGSSSGLASSSPVAGVPTLLPSLDATKLGAHRPTPPSQAPPESAPITGRRNVSSAGRRSPGLGTASGPVPAFGPGPTSGGT